MAAEKKKAEKKSAEKKTTKKVVAAKAPAKKGKKKLTSSDLTINVPKGGQVIKHFTLTPALPAGTTPGNWLFVEDGTTQDIQSMTIGFELNPSALERALERAVLVVKMVQTPALNGTWRFALGGVATDHADEDPSNDLTVEIIDNGFTMLVYVQVLENSTETIPFGFVASFTKNSTGAVSIYESKDPGITPVRPTGG